MSVQRRQVLLSAGLLIALLAAYWNHFGNGFHFDDAHTVVDNPSIRALSDVPRFFVDAGTFNHDPAGQSYRPIVTASLALDYWLGGGLKPFWFHLSTFLWFVVQLFAMYWLYLFVLQGTCPNTWNEWVAWFAVAVYALHPAGAETVNYIVQRGDLYVALGIVSGVAAYAYKPAWRRYGLYLIPPLAGMFAKPTGIIFAPLLLTYMILVDRDPLISQPAANKPKTEGRQGRQPTVLPRSVPLKDTVLRSIPAFVVCGVFLVVEKVMTPPTIFQTKISTFDYLITQPYVTLRYLRSFFLPFYLSADTDLWAFHSLGNPDAFSGCVFCILLVAAAIFAARTRELRPISFGLSWFLIALIPTAVFPLGEVENDHRMFLPYIGLSLAATYGAALFLHRFDFRRRTALAVAGSIVLGALAWGTHVRNEVWRTDESLWRDATQKSPGGARAHVNYGLALSDLPGRLPEAIAEYQTALRIDPQFPDAHGNLGVALSRIPGRSTEAIGEYQAALRVKPDSSNLHLNLGKILAQVPDRLPDAVREFEAALKTDPDSADAHVNLGVSLSHLPGRLPEAIAEYRTALRIDPNFPEAHCSLAIALSQTGPLPEAIAEYEAALRLKPDYADAHLDLAVVLLRIPGRLAGAIAHYESALQLDRALTLAHMDLGSALAALPNRTPEAAVAELRALLLGNPGSAEAHYALGAILSKDSGRLPEAIAQHQAALQIRPDYGAAHAALGIALSRTPGRLPEAISQFQSAVKLQPDSAEAHSNLALALSMAGRKPEAISEFEASFRIRPDPGVQNMLISLGAKSRER